MGDFFYLLLVTVTPILYVRSTTIDQTGDKFLTTDEIFLINLTDYLVPFENCTTMVFTRDKLYLGSKWPTHVPIISLVYDTKISLVTGKLIEDKFSMVRRRNPHCWATFAIIPEKGGFSERKQYILIFSAYPHSFKKHGGRIILL